MVDRINALAVGCTFWQGQCKNIQQNLNMLQGSGQEQQNLNMLHKFAFNIIRIHKRKSQSKLPLNGILFRALMNPHVLLLLLGKTGFPWLFGCFLMPSCHAKTRSLWRSAVGAFTLSVHQQIRMQSIPSKRAIFSRVSLKWPIPIAQWWEGPCFDHASTKLRAEIGNL